MNIKKHITHKSLFLLLLAALSGCGRKKQRTIYYQDTDTSMDMPQATEHMEVAQADLRSFFDQESDEFVALNPADQPELAIAFDEPNSQSSKHEEYAWIEAADLEQEQFKTVYFDFDKHAIRTDQEEIVAFDASQALKVLTDVRDKGFQPTVVIEGHACNSAGKALYNLALSERRAKVVADWFLSAGVPKENIKIVGRGKEIPARIDGKNVTGDRLQQWPNRRVEVHIVYS